MTIQGYHAHGRTRRVISTTLSVLVALAAACSVHAQIDTGRLSSQLILYLEGPSKTEADIIAHFASVNLLGESDTILLVPPVESISARDVSGQQILLLEAAIPPGRYNSIELSFDLIRGFAGKAEIELGIDSTPVSLPWRVDVAPGTAQVIFLGWTTQRIDFEEKIYRPGLFILSKNIPPLGSLAFVSNEMSGNVSVFDRSSLRVLDVIKVGEEPRGMVYSPNSQQLFVANAATSTISVIDGLSRQVVRTISLNFGDEPSRLSLSPDERFLYVLNYGSASVTMVDLVSYQETARAGVELGPVSITTDSNSGHVYVSNMLSDNIQEYDPISQTVIRTLSIGSSPSEVVVDQTERLLYLARSTQRTISAYDLLSGTLRPVASLCSPAGGLVYDPRSERLYAAIPRCSEIAVLKPKGELELASISLPFSPGQITADREYRELLVTAPDSNQVGVVNITRRRLTGTVNVGRMPYMVAVP